ncbi:ATP-dependent 3'-5' DNA helicase, partial [Linderina macrospora]
LRGEDVVVSTATASGKSAIYQVPILQALVDNPQSKALLIFPTKALAQDQLGSFQQLAQGIPGLENVVIEAFDGDTRGGKAGERQRIRESASVILTNPDTLHTAMLQNKKMWAHVFNNLRYVVIDELHVYYGQFGQHVSCIMARLARVCEKATFQFICCSATTSNPRELAQQITHRKEFTVVDTDGSPRAGMHMVLWDSAAVKKQSKQTSDLVRIAAALLQNGTRTIVFCKFRQVCELVAREIVDYLEASPDLRVLKRFVASYRAGYTLEQRRQIEQDMFSGITRMIVATSALELGIDVGVLDAVLMVGVPANKVNLWQQAGRAGRRGRASLAMVIATGNLVDRQVVKRPSDLFVREFQSMHITSEKSTALGHLQCAAFEQAIDMTSQIDRDLVHNMQLDADDLDSSLVWDVVTQQWIAAMGFKPWPAEKVPIRSIQQSEWQVVETHGSSGPTLLEELDGIHALFTLYEGGILLHRARTYEIDKVDAESRVALVHSADVSWFTTARDYVDVIPGSICKSSVHGGLSYGDVEVRATVFGYKRIDQRTKRVLELVERRSPVLTAQSLG